MDLVLIYSLPFVTALIGWFTNKVAVKMLFHPKNPVAIIGFKWQGLIPRRQAEIAKETGEIVEKELLQAHLLSSSLREMDLQPHFHEFIDEVVSKGLVQQLQSMPLIGSFLNDSLVDQFLGMAKQEVDKQSGPFIEKIAGDVEKQVQVRQLVEDRINALDLNELERLVHRIAAKEFRRIEFLGGLLGFIIGLAQLGLLVLSGNFNTISCLAHRYLVVRREHQDRDFCLNPSVVLFKETRGNYFAGFPDTLHRNPSPLRRSIIVVGGLDDSILRSHRRLFLRNLHHPTCGFLVVQFTLRVRN